MRLQGNHPDQWKCRIWQPPLLSFATKCANIDMVSSLDNSHFISSEKYRFLEVHRHFFTDLDFATLPICFICNSTWTLRTGDKELQLGCEISEGLFSCALSNPRLSFKARFYWVEFKVAWKPFASLSLHSLNQDCICYNNISSVGVGELDCLPHDNLSNDLDHRLEVLNAGHQWKYCYNIVLHMKKAQQSKKWSECRTEQ